jgi:transcriptional regulator with XRE-family HTH domain
MARRRRFSAEPFGRSVERLMSERGFTYRGLAERSGLSAGYLNHLVHGNRPVPSNEVIGRLAASLDVTPEHFREDRLRVITERLEATPQLADRLYQRLGTSAAPHDGVRSRAVPRKRAALVAPRLCPACAARVPMSASSAETDSLSADERRRTNRFCRAGCYPSDP